MKIFKAVVCFLLLVITGCMSQIGIGPIDTSRIPDLRPGHSTKDEVRGMFGVPLHTIRSSGVEIWVYRFSPESCGSNDIHQELTISFNSDDRVSAFSHQ